MIIDKKVLGSDKEKIELSIQKKQEVEKLLFIGILKPKANQRVFKVDLLSGEVSEVEDFIKSETIKFHNVNDVSEPINERDILLIEGFDYVVKLNMGNAVKYFKKKHSTLDIAISKDTVAKTMKKNQRKVNEYKNKS